MKRMLTIALFFALSINLKAQDSITHNNEKYFQKFSIKLPVLFLFSEIPLLVEYRPVEHLGHEFSVGYVYFKIDPYYKSYFGNGYKIKYALRYYFRHNEKRNSYWFVSPQIFYKQMWLKDCNYNSDYFLLGSGGHEDNDIYNFNEDRRVFALELLTGFSKKFDHMTFELYFGASVRELTVYDHITKWIALSGHYHEPPPANLPDHKNWQVLKASVNFGMNLSFAVHKRK